MIFFNENEKALMKYMNENCNANLNLETLFNEYKKITQNKREAIIGIAYSPSKESNFIYAKGFDAFEDDTVRELQIICCEVLNLLKNLIKLELINIYNFNNGTHMYKVYPMFQEKPAKKKDFDDTVKTIDFISISSQYGSFNDYEYYYFLPTANLSHFISEESNYRTPEEIFEEQKQQEVISANKNTIRVAIITVIISALVSILTTIITTSINHNDSFDVQNSYEVLSNNITTLQNSITKDISTLQNGINTIMTTTTETNITVTSLNEAYQTKTDSLSVPSKEAATTGEQ